MNEPNKVQMNSMVVVIDVEKGDIKGIYGTAKDEVEIQNAIGGEPAEVIDDPDKLTKIRQSSLNEVEPMSIFGATHNPTCRYVKVGGTWRRVCR